MKKFSWRDYRDNLPMVPMFFTSPKYMLEMMKNEGHTYSETLYMILLDFFQEVGEQALYNMVYGFYRKYYQPRLTIAEILEGNSVNDPYKLSVNELF